MFVSNEGKIVIVGCLIEIHDRAGLVSDWWELWKTREDFYEAAGLDGQRWFSPSMGKIIEKTCIEYFIVMTTKC